MLMSQTRPHWQCHIRVCTQVRIIIYSDSDSELSPCQCVAFSIDVCYSVVYQLVYVSNWNSVVFHTKSVVRCWKWYDLWGVKYGIILSTNIHGNLIIQSSGACMNGMKLNRAYLIEVQYLMYSDDLRDIPLKILGGG